MFAPCSANVRATSSSSRARSHASTAICARQLVGLEAVQDLVHDLAGADLPGAEREVEVLGLLEAHLADHGGEHARALELAVWEVLRLQRLVERLPALLLG